MSGFLLRAMTLLLASFALTACATVSPLGPDEVSRLHTLGIDPVLFDRALADGGNGRLDSLVVARDGQTLLERSFHGEIDSPHDLRSATKTITGLLIGIAIDRGLMTLDEKILKWFPEQASRSDTFGDITIKHLLTMTSGLDSDDWDPQSPGDEEVMYQKRSWVDFFFSLRKVDAAGAKFRYSTAGVVLLGEILHRATGMAFDEWAQTVLFAPLGITAFVFERTPAGEVDSGGHLRLTTRDFLKIAQLAFDKGQFAGKRIVSEAWIEASLKPAVRVTGAPESGPWFGYLWWLEPVVGTEVRSYQARGNGGQMLIVVPSRHLVAAFTGSAYNSDAQMQPFVLMKQHFIPAVPELP